MALKKQLYNIFLRRTSTFALTIGLGTFFFERSLDIAADYFWRTHNKGVSLIQTIILFYIYFYLCLFNRKKSESLTLQVLDITLVLGVYMWCSTLFKFRTNKRVAMI